MMREPTIYGRTEGDLASAIGPVPIMWSVEPPPPSPQPLSQPLQQQQQQFLSNGLGQRVMQGIRRPATAPTSGPMNASAVTQAGASGVPMQGARRPATAPTNGPMNAPAVTQAGAAGAPPVSGKGGQGGGGVMSAMDQKVAGGVIPRTNFFPRGPGLRPRSRSFSRFNSQTKNTEVAPPVQRRYVYQTFLTLNDSN